MRLFTSTAIAWFSAGCWAAPNGPTNICFVRPDTVSVKAGENGESRQAQSYLGLRPKGTQLFELDISVAGDNAAVCSVNGVARLRGEPGRETLALVVRPDPTFKNVRTGTLCQVFVQLTPTAVELATTQSSCRAQALCGGQVQLHGQRFENSTKLPATEKGPCFSTRAP
jgi:hypothetical protein